ncbi:MAG: sigma factor [Planctomycetota bacterium]
MDRLYGPAVYRWARQAGLQASDAADVVQEVFTNVAADIATFRRDLASIPEHRFTKVH